MLRFPSAAFTVALACSGAALAQTADPNLTFEVATIKPAAPPSAADGKRMIRMGASGGPGTADPGQVSYNFTNVHMLIVQAFGLKTYQVTGPATIDSERYEIVAKVPKGATKDDVKIMLQNLLKDRFGVVYHREKKEMGVYALVVGKNGPKLTESADQSDPAAAPPPTAAAEGGGPSAATAPPGPPDPMKLKMGPDGMPMLPSRPGLSNMMMMGPNGARAKMIGNRATLTQLADSLANQLDKPPVDMTGLDKRYDFTLDFAPDMGAMQSKAGNLMMGPPPGGGGEMHGAGDAPRAANPEEGASLFTALQEQLGLKLEPRKAPVDLLVVEKVAKTPTEN